MPKPRQFFEAMVEDLFYFNILVTPFAFVLAALTGGINAPLGMLLFLPVLVYHYAVRTFVPKFLPFLILTWIVCTAALLTHNYVMNMIFIAILCSRSVRRRTNEGTKLRITFETLAFPLIMLAVLYSAADYLGIPQMRIFFHFQAVAVFLLSLIYTHLRGINSELELASSNSLQSTKEITGFVNKYLAVYIIGFFIVLALFRFVPFGNAMAFVGGIAAYMIRYILGFIKLGGYQKMGIPIDGTGDEFIPYDMDVPPAPAWLRLIENIAMCIVNIAVLALLVLSVVFIFLRMYYGFYKKREIKITNLIGTSEISAIPPVKEKKKHVHITDPTRRRFYKRMNKYFKKNILKSSDTPLEMRERIKDKENISDLAELYENVRYSDR